MRITEVLVSDEDLFVCDIFEPEQDNPDFINYEPYRVPLEEALAITEVPGYGKNVSAFVVELVEKLSSDKVLIDEVINVLRENFPESEISWQQTLHYLADRNIS